MATVAAAGFLSLWFDLLTFAVPLNLGTLEGSRILVFKALGCPALLGMTYAVAVRLAQVFWACFGLASYSLLTGLSETSSNPPGLRVLDKVLDQVTAKGFQNDHSGIDP